MRLAFVDSGPCGADVFWDRTDATGRTRVQAEGCGEHLLVIGSHGMRTERRVVDSCRDQHLEVELTRAPSPPQPVDFCARTALEFAQAWWTGERHRAGALLALGAEVPEPAHAEGAVAPWGISVISHERRSDTCTACLRLTYEYGCEPVYAIDLRAEGEAWRVLGFGQSSRCPER